MALINMLSSADKVKGQGVGSAYLEQVSLIREGLAADYAVAVNSACLCDITHYHTIDLKFFLGLPLARRLGKTVGYVHFLPETIDGSLTLPPLAKALFYKYIIAFYRRMDYLVTVNPYFIERLAAHGIDPQRVSYIPNHVSRRDFYPRSRAQNADARQQWAIPADRFVVLGVGQIQTRKGILDFVATAKRLPEVYFVWAGGFSFGRISDGYHELKKVVNDPPANVKFLGIVPRAAMNAIYNLADMLFMPSYNELFPMAILEAVNCAKPLLLRELELYEKILFDHYLKANSVDDFAAQIERLRSDPACYRQWQDAAVNCSAFYGRENVLALWKAFYDRVHHSEVGRSDYLGSRLLARFRSARRMRPAVLR